MKLREKINIFSARSPKKTVLIAIMVFNVLFILIAAAILAGMSRQITGIKEMGFWESVYHTISMMLDAGCIEAVIKDVGQAGACAAIVCLVVVIVGMILLAGAIIGYVTNFISDYIQAKNNGKSRLIISDHIVIINWSPRGAEIISELMYTGLKLNIVVFVPEEKDRIKEAIQNRIDTALIREMQQIREETKDMSRAERRKYMKLHRTVSRITYIVKEGDIAAAKDLDDICISRARAVIILDNGNTSVKTAEDRRMGNTQTVKALIQVSEISQAGTGQTIAVETADEWTDDIVRRIININKAYERIVPICHKRMLGRINAQMAVMPELYDVYDRLFSEEGPHIIAENIPDDSGKPDISGFAEKHLTSNFHSVPLSVMNTHSGRKAFYSALCQDDIRRSGEHTDMPSAAHINDNYTFRGRNILVLGHNSNMQSLMDAFSFFVNQIGQSGRQDTLKIIMLDDEESLKANNMYRDYPFAETLAADVYDENTITGKLTELSRDVQDETTVLILSDDSAENEDEDANVLTYLIYIRELIRYLDENEPEFRTGNLDIICEIRNPKNEDIVRNYGAGRVIISNRYVGSVIAKISLEEAGYELFAGRYETEKSSGGHLQTVNAADFFECIPGKCTAAELIRMAYAGCTENRKAIILGYIRDGHDYVFFSGDQRNVEICLRADDSIILFCTPAAI